MNANVFMPTMAHPLLAVSVPALVQIVVLPLLGLAVLMCVIRLIRGPDLANRVIAFDLLSSLGIAILATYAIATQQPAYFDVGLVLALVTFMGTVAFAHYMQNQSS